MDILATAIGRPDDLHQVRGEPSGVTVTSYFGRAPRSSSSVLNKEALVEEIRRDLEEKMQEKMQQNMKVEMEKMRSQVMSMVQAAGPTFSSSHPPTVIVTSESHHPPSSPPPSEPGKPCNLWLDEPSLRKVAEGLVYIRATMHHNVKIPDTYRKVSVTKVEPGEEATYLPFAEDEVDKLGEAIGFMILWPLDLVRSGTTPPMSPITNTNFNNLMMLYANWRRYGNVDIQMPGGIVGEEETYSVGLVPEDFAQLLALEELDIGWFEVGVMILHRLACERGDVAKYGFLSPSKMARGTSPNLAMKRNAKIFYAAQILSEGKKVYLAPILLGSHYVLCAVVPAKNVVYYMDSLGGDTPEELKVIFNCALTMYKTLRTRTSVVAPTAGATKWIRCAVPRQPDAKQCGYYCLFFMHTIICSGSVYNFEKHIFDNPDEELEEQQVNLIRDLLAGAVVEAALEML